MKNIDVATLFLGKNDCRGSNLYSINGKLYDCRNEELYNYVSGITGKDIKTVKVAYDRFVAEAVNSGVKLA